ncbi:MAG: beta-ketoacyl synthase N-terminal-like domain-containing protein, partial [Pseudomonadota bacterium]
MSGNVVITGLGAVSSLGVGIDEHREALLGGRRCMAAPTVFDVGQSEPFPVAEIKAGGRFAKLPASLERYDTREARICRHACREALSDSGAPDFYDHDIAFYVGTTSSGVHELEEAWAGYKSTGAVAAEWDFANQHLAGAIARAMVKSLGLTGMHTTVSTACSSSANAMILAALDIIEGRCRAAAVLGVDT